jgi:hypothetical protein
MIINKRVRERPIDTEETKASIRRLEELVQRVSDCNDRIQRAYLELEEAYRRHGVTRDK